MPQPDFYSFLGDRVSIGIYSRLKQVTGPIEIGVSAGEKTAFSLFKIGIERRQLGLVRKDSFRSKFLATGHRAAADNATEFIHAA